MAVKMEMEGERGRVILSGQNPSALGIYTPEQIIIIIEFV